MPGHYKPNRAMHICLRALSAGPCDLYEIMARAPELRGIPAKVRPRLFNLLTDGLVAFDGMMWSLADAGRDVLVNLNSGEAVEVEAPRRSARVFVRRERAA